MSAKPTQSEERGFALFKENKNQQLSPSTEGQQNQNVRQQNEQVASPQQPSQTQPEKDAITNSKELKASGQLPQQAQAKKRYIGHYIIGETLGEGTFGKVKMASHILTGEKVAIKILEKQKIVDVADVERVSREIHILKLLRHQNIIQLYEIIETQKLLFLVTEYASGGELFDYIVKNNRVPEKEASVFFQQILSGVEYIHKLKVVHRDLKPENLLLSEKRKIKIVDFGLSNTYKRNELLKTACGSPCYAAPEMIAGKRYQGLGVDIWSCGVILFALVCGYLPFEDPNTSTLYKKIMSGEFQIPKFVSSDGKDLIKQILNTDPSKRITISDIRKHPWFNQIRSSPQCDGIIVGYNRIPIDEKILAQLEKYKVNLDQARSCIEANKHNHLTTSYYLLLRKHIRSGGISIADISSEKFDNSLIQPPKVAPPNKYEAILEEEKKRWDKLQFRSRLQEDQSKPTPFGAVPANQSQRQGQVSSQNRQNADTPVGVGVFPNILTNSNISPFENLEPRNSSTGKDPFSKFTSNNFFYDKQNPSTIKQILIGGENHKKNLGIKDINSLQTPNNNNYKLHLHPNSMTSSPQGTRSNSRQKHSALPKDLIYEPNRHSSLDQSQNAPIQFHQTNINGFLNQNLILYPSDQKREHSIELTDKKKTQIHFRNINQTGRNQDLRSKEKDRGKQFDPSNTSILELGGNINASHNNSPTTSFNNTFLLNISSENNNPKQKHSRQGKYALDERSGVQQHQEKRSGIHSLDEQIVSSKQKNKNHLNLLQSFANNFLSSNNQAFPNSNKNQLIQQQFTPLNNYNAMPSTTAYQGFHRNKLTKMLATPGGNNRVGTAFNLENQNMSEQSEVKQYPKSEFTSQNNSLNTSINQGVNDSLNASLNLNNTVYGATKRRFRPS